jgi:threonine aldolase
MREAIACADVGDDGHGEDPTVLRLEEIFARMVGKEAAVFVPSGVMGNQIAIRILTSPGDVVAVGAHQHVVAFELGASARNAAVQFAPLDDSRGVLSIDELLERVDAATDHQPAIAAVSIENTHMYAGGVPWSAAETSLFASALDGLPLHLDGARLFNAAVATGDSPSALAGPARTVMSCLSKGLAAPVGSLVAGSRTDMERARVERKRLGGSMRQAGIVAAAGIVALESMVDRLVVDHERASQLAAAVATRFPESGYDPESCRTNIVAFDHPDARSIVARLAEADVLAETIGPRRVRLVTHLDLTDEMIERACSVIGSLRLN